MLLAQVGIPERPIPRSSSSASSNSAPTARREEDYRFHLRSRWSIRGSGKRTTSAASTGAITVPAFPGPTPRSRLPPAGVPRIAETAAAVATTAATEAVAGWNPLDWGRSPTTIPAAETMASFPRKRSPSRRGVIEGGATAAVGSIIRAPSAKRTTGGGETTAAAAAANGLRGLGRRGTNPSRSAWHRETWSGNLGLSSLQNYNTAIELYIGIVTPNKIREPNSSIVLANHLLNENNIAVASVRSIGLIWSDRHAFKSEKQPQSIIVLFVTLILGLTVSLLREQVRQPELGELGQKSSPGSKS